MHLKTLKIKNFRALADIHVDFESRVNVIVGPNAVGKTTVLEAIRIVKAILAPRTANEANQVLFSLGVASPHMPQRLRLDAIARDPTQPVVIGCRYSLSDEEFSSLEKSSDQIALTAVQSRLGQGFANPGILIGYLSSPEGQTQLNTTKSEITRALDRMRATKQCHLELTISAEAGLTASSETIEINFVSFLEQRLPPDKTSFTYFPADRALPSGEQPVQLGSADAMQQVESYNSQPQTKYSRLKNLIFSATIMDRPENGVPNITDEFAKIFSGILKGRKLLGVGINEIGLLSVRIQDTENGRIFDLDGMSSGEKGLILTFLLIERSVVNGGLILLDEPELHLNPAVCKDLLAYLVDEYVIRKDLQIIVCSHSPEVLAGAFDSDECGLYHLISESNLSKVRRQDQLHVSDALRRLGAPESDGLLYRGIIFVEGIDDVALLEAGFGPLFKKFKIRESKGRKEVEKAIADLQTEEKNGLDSGVRYFIFDRDDQPTQLKSSQHVKILQWDRRCLENYLLDLDSIANLLMDSEVTRSPFSNHGDVSKFLRETASKQLDEIAARRVYERYAYDDVRLRKEDIQSKQIAEISDSLFSRIEKSQLQISSLKSGEWKSIFQQNVAVERKQLEAVWETTWLKDCDGKKLLEDIHKSAFLKMNLRKFKIKIMREMMETQSETWRAVGALIKDLLEKDPR